MAATPVITSGEGLWDLSTVAGLLVAILGVMGGLLLEGGRVGDVVQLTAALIVLGGTAGAVMVTTPSALFVAAMKRVPCIFWHRPSSADRAKNAVLLFAAQSRKTGIASLEPQLKLIDNAFLRKALGLSVDGADSKTVRSIMQLELDAAEERGEAIAGVFESAGGYAPTIGILGAVLGLIQVMKHLGDIEAVGHGIAVAFVATVYGVSVANLVLLPIANKLRSRLSDELRWKELVLEGISAMTEGLHPWLIESKLEAFRDTQTEALVKSGSGRARRTAAVRDETGKKSAAA